MHITFIEFDYFTPQPKQCRFSDITWPLATALAAAGDEVTIIAPCTTAFSAPPIGFVPVPAAISQRQNVGVQIKRALTLARAARQIDADVYHVHQSVVAAGMTMCGLGAKTVWHGHSNYYQRTQYPHAAYDKWMDRLIRIATKVAARRVAVIALGPQVVPYWERAGFARERIGIAPYATPLLSEMAATVPQGHPWSCAAWEGKQFKLLYVGRLSADKGGQSELLDALTLLKNDSIGLAVLGDGELRPTLEIQARDLPVSFCGNVSHDEVMRAIGSADLLILTSYAEMLPRTILEAWSVGTAVMSTNVGAIGDYLHDGENGYLLDNREPAYLAGRVRVAMNVEERERIGHNGQIMLNTTLTWEKLIVKYQQIYASML